MIDTSTEGELEEQFSPYKDMKEYPENSMDFVEKALTFDPEKRPSIEELLQHPWIKNNAYLIDENMTNSKFENHVN